jgi:hypothetical protein
MELKEITDFELFLNKKNLDILRDLSRKDIKEENVQLIIKLLDRLLIYFVYAKDKSSFEKLFRLTINKTIIGENTRLKYISNLKYPPDKKVIKKYGRCNLPKQSILYASLMSMTSLNEMKPRTRDLITETVWKRKSTKQMVCIPVFSNQPTNAPMINIETGETIPFLTNIRTLEMDERFKKQISDYPKNLRELSILVVQFIADCFSKTVNPINHFNYVFSAYISDKFFNEVESGEIDAMYYPSVANKLNTENLAIKPYVFDELYEPFGVVESEVLTDPSQGSRSYQMDPIAATTKFNMQTGEIYWDEDETNDALFKILDMH